MAAIGGLSAAIAHEIRNPLASICNAVEMLSEHIEVKDDHDARLLAVIEKESARLQRISTDFLHFARMKQPDIAPVDLHTLAGEVILLAGNDPRKTEDVVMENYVPEHTGVCFDTDQLRQLLLNLLINSLDAVGGDGTIRVSVEEMPPSSEGEYVRVIVSDSGPGFGDGSIESVFEPFYSTKESGTGLGLALVRKIMISNGGRVFARNAQIGGAEIILDMKAAGEAS